jgi:predicted nucleic acid-binding protein
MRWYLDSSLALHAVLPWGDARARIWLDTIHRQGGEVFSSTLLELELIRTLRRERLDLVRAQSVLKRITLVSIDDGILRFAAAIEPHVKSLDAIHLATCSLLGSGVTVVTHDGNMAAVAAQLGLDSIDPLSPKVDA